MVNITMEERQEPGHCDHHGEYVGTFRRMGGKDFPPKCPECTKKAAAEREAYAARCAEQERRRRIEAMIDRSDIPLRFAERTLANYRTPTDSQAKALNICTRYAESFGERWRSGGGLLLCGNPGTGKTHLACAIANHVIREHVLGAKYTTVYNVVRKVRSAWGRDSQITEEQAIAEIAAPALLVVDEVGVQYGSESERIILFEVLNRRYEDMRPTILISNLNPDGVAEAIGERNIDRMREGGGAVLGFSWGSYRGEVHKDDALSGTGGQSGR
jgi:DNA replication protein DnaC